MNVRDTQYSLGSFHRARNVLSIFCGRLKRWWGWAPWNMIRFPFKRSSFSTISINYLNFFGCWVWISGFFIYFHVTSYDYLLSDWRKNTFFREANIVLNIGVVSKQGVSTNFSQFCLSQIIAFKLTSFCGVNVPLWESTLISKKLFFERFFDLVNSWYLLNKNNLNSRPIQLLLDHWESPWNKLVSFSLVEAVFITTRRNNVMFRTLVQGYLVIVQTGSVKQEPTVVEHFQVVIYCRKLSGMTRRTTISVCATLDVKSRYVENLEKNELFTILLFITWKVLISEGSLKVKKVSLLNYKDDQVG